MTINVDSFLERYPVFTGVNIDIIQQEIDLSYIRFTNFNSQFIDKAVGLFVAHVLRLEYADQLKMGSALRSIEEGKEIKVDVIEQSESYFNKTIYGQQLLNLLKQFSGFSMYVI